jgi:hypothetical protein
VVVGQHERADHLFDCADRGGVAGGRVRVAAVDLAPHLAQQLPGGLGSGRAGVLERGGGGGVDPPDEHHRGGRPVHLVGRAGVVEQPVELRDRRYALGLVAQLDAPVGRDHGQVGELAVQPVVEMQGEVDCIQQPGAVEQRVEQRHGLPVAVSGGDRNQPAEQLVAPGRPQPQRQPLDQVGREEPAHPAT